MTNTHPKARILQKVINVFCGETLTLLMVTRFTASEKVQKIETPKQDGR